MWPFKKAEKTEELLPDGLINEAVQESYNHRLRLPKESLVILNVETKEIVAANGRWARLPMDGEPLQSLYLSNHPDLVDAIKKAKL